MVERIEAENRRVSWADRRSRTMGRIADLKEQRGAALIAGVDFDSEAIRGAEDELDAIDAAEAADARRERQRLLADDEERRQKARRQLMAVMKTRESAIQRAEDACHALASALGSIVETSNEASRLIRLLGFPAPMSLTDNNVKLTASFRLASILHPVCGRKFGQISLPVGNGENLPDGTKASDGWKLADRKKTAAAVDAALGTGDLSK
ncbi:hypothetical protein ACMFL9_27375 [Sinorhizobium meliloti]